MRQFKFLLIAMTLVLGMTACSGSQPGSSETPAQDAASASAKPSEEASDKPSEEASEKPSEEASDKPSEQASDKPSEAASNAPAAKADGPEPKFVSKLKEDNNDAEGPLVIYSGRNEKLVDPIIQRMKDALGIDIEVHYDKTSATAAKILEEGDASPADLFFSQDAGALGLMKNDDKLADLGELTKAIAPTLVDPDNKWVATSVRARVLTYNDNAKEAADFKHLDEILNDKYKGRIGYAPTNASFQSFVTALRVIKGEDGAKKWLEDFLKLEPKTYPKNTAVLNAVDSGEVDLGLINHYYWYRAVAEKGEAAMKAKLKYFEPTEAGGLLNVAGVGVLKTAKHPHAARVAVEYLLSERGQLYFADKTAEYPVIAGVTSDKFTLHPIDIENSTVDLNQLDSLDKTQQLLSDVGMI